MLRLCISYAREDSAWCERIAKQLAALKPRLLEEIWYDRDIPLGGDWRHEITSKLDEADVVLLLLSDSYFDSKVCGEEAEHAIHRHRRNEIEVIPVILEPVALEYSDYEKLNVFPPPDNPLSKWPDPKEALAQLTRKIGEYAKKKVEGSSANKLPHPNARQLGELLQHLCNRSRQCDAVREALVRHKQKPRRPFVVVMQGGWQDAYPYFVLRLESTILPGYLQIKPDVQASDKPGRLSPMVWPEYDARKTPLELFSPKFAECVPEAEFAATADEINAKLKLCNVANLVETTISAGEWNTDTERLFDAYLQFWEEWPAFPEDRMVIPIVTIEYGKNPERNASIAAFLKGVDIESRSGFDGVVLPPFPEIRRLDVANWIQNRSIRDLFRCSTEQAISRLDVIFKEENQSFPMKPLAESHFPRYLDHL